MSNVRYQGEAWLEFLRLESLNTDDCVLWPLGTVRAREGNEYGVVKEPHLQRTIRTHRLALMRATGRWPDRHVQARHVMCGNKLCMNVKHLAWGDAKDNHDDRHRLGERVNAGTENPKCVLSLEQVRRIKFGDEDAQALADELGVARSHVYNIRNGQSWKNVEAL